MMNLTQIAQSIKDAQENIFLLYAFNGTGKTRLCRKYKDITKDIAGNHTGVYYNAFSEDLFHWHNDEENDNEQIRLEVVQSSLSPLHQYFGDETPIKQRLRMYQPTYNFRFKFKNDNPEKGIEYIWFFKEEDQDTWIKISRGEERIFIWCFFLALFDIEDFKDAHKEYIFIDDPVSSLDDTNIYLTAMTLFELMEKSVVNDKKLIISTHHIGLFSILMDWLKKGENANKFKEKILMRKEFEQDGESVVREEVVEKNKFQIKILEKQDENYILRGQNSGAWLYHLLLIQKLQQAIDNDELYLYHFGMLRQILEIIASFIGAGRMGQVLHDIGEPDDTADKINANSHRRVYDAENAKLIDDNKVVFTRVLSNIITHYKFQI